MKQIPTALAILISAIWAPAIFAASGAAAADENFVACQDPRPEICMEIYAPVCATIDTGVRCVTTPCPALKQETQANACYACRLPQAIGYTPGACEAQGDTTGDTQ